ncbi:MAG TPA: hypothetical protein VHM31_13300 [Polyangia bacterium]|nr:hypothetical protein [Polyangia bacterium]
MESMEPEIALPTAEPAPPPVVFSELIDRWLREGERLHEAAPPDDGSAAAGSDAGLARDSWRTRTAELWRTILERHRLEALVALGLLPLMLFLALQGHAAGHSPPAGAQPAVRAVVTAPELPTLRRRAPARPASRGR